MARLPAPGGERVLVGTGIPDDAGVYLLAPGLALVQTVDFFTPIVDDPYDFGRIAAANALSDIYAMGAAPLTALAIAAFPSKTLPLAVLERILRGGIDKAAEAGCVVIGGHTIDDPEPKYGLAVTGTADPDRLWKRTGARAGDVLVLTKPLGTGILATAIKKGLAGAETIARVTEAMATLNRGAAEACRTVAPHAVTDVTGFGLTGHLAEMMRYSGVTARVRTAGLPVHAEARGWIAGKIVPGGTLRNLDFARPRMRVLPGVSPDDEVLVADAQTSGGLLIAVAADEVDRLLAALASAKTPAAAVIGEVVPRAEGVDLVLEP